MNKIRLSGAVITNIELSHKFLGENFYKFNMEVNRTSGTSDIIPCIVPQVYLGEIKEGARISAIGEIRSRSYRDEDEKPHCQLSVFINEITEYIGHDDNIVELEGYICKEPKYRDTPLGRQISDLLIASNREKSRKSDYIPCIAWGRNAVRTKTMEVGIKIKAKGRFQSREYTKLYEDGTEVIMTAYEVSINTISEVADES